MNCLEQIPQGVIKMSESMEDTVETSNNIGRIQTEEDCIFISTHTRSFIDTDMKELSRKIADVFAENGAKSEMVMSAPQIASIGPRIVEPHSTSERVELKTIEDIWQVLIELLKRLADGTSYIK